MGQPAILPAAEDKMVLCDQGLAFCKSQHTKGPSTPLLAGLETITSTRSNLFNGFKKKGLQKHNHIQNLTRTMVLREDQAKATYTQKVDFAKLRSELLSADSTESATTRASHERLTNDLAKLNSRLRDEVGRTQASVRLDLNLEKGRIREEANVQELKIKETETKIEQEVAGLREKLEAVKFQTLQWLMGVCTGTAALILGAWRLLM
ncbi:hypothetical protein IFR04_000110 [Cadophora malorum]|uniref:DUF1640-domain-containing protein n=1 Tax=Cadophora malorum TaxID=108018 RepID=A0A8H7WKY5_9HELO|nr:hypothetical protein IFR04_000110 [Cadophora malorum]